MAPEVVRALAGGTLSMQEALKIDDTALMEVLKVTYT